MADSVFVNLASNGSSGSSALVVGTTTITGGTTTRVLYDNAGVLGEMTTSGTGTQLALTAGPTFTGSPVLGTPTATRIGVGAAADSLIVAKVVTTDTTHAGLYVSAQTSTSLDGAGITIDMSAANNNHLNLSTGGTVRWTDYVNTALDRAWSSPSGVRMLLSATGNLSVTGTLTATGVIQGGGYKSSDGTAGATAGPFTTITAITVKNGLVTAITGS